MASSPSSLLSPTPKLHLIAPTPPRTPTPLSLNNPTPLSLLSLKNPNPTTANLSATSRRSLAISTISGILLSVAIPATSLAASDEEYVRETEDVINKVRNTINMEKGDPNVADAVAELREASNSWVAKYRREKELLGRSSFRDMYSVLNAVSGHYISFGPTAPIPAKRKARILEEMDTAEKALQRGR